MAYLRAVDREVIGGNPGFEYPIALRVGRVNIIVGLEVVHHENRRITSEPFPPQSGMVIGLQSPSQHRGIYCLFESPL